MLKFSGFANLTSCLERRSGQAESSSKDRSFPRNAEQESTLNRGLPSYSLQKHSHTSKYTDRDKGAEHFDAQYTANAAARTDKRQLVANAVGTEAGVLSGIS